MRLLAKPTLVVLVRDIDATSAQLLQPQLQTATQVSEVVRERAPGVWMAMVKIGGRAVSRKLSAVLRCLAFRASTPQDWPSKAHSPLPHTDNNDPAMSMSLLRFPRPALRQEPTGIRGHGGITCLRFMSRSLKRHHPSRDFEPSFAAVFLSGFRIVTICLLL